MGNALSNTNVDKPNKKSLSQIIDYVATNYILTQNFKDMEKLTDTEYCNNLVILTSKIVDQKLSNLEINYLTQRLQGKSEINEMASDKLIYFKKDAIDKFDVQNIQNATQKRRMCIGIAKFYVKVAQVFSAIVTTINPTYKFKDISGNKQEVDLSQKQNIPDEATASIQRINMCSQRINALINGQKFNPDQKEPLKISPKFCEINFDSKTGKSRNLYSEPGMPELEKLYFDKYDYDHGGFVGMTEQMRKTVYEKDVETLYRAFTGNDTIPLDDKGEKTIKTFTQIPLRNYKTTEGCNPGGKYTKVYEGTIKEKLFYDYAIHVNTMMNNANSNQDKLLAIIDRLFSFNINPLTQKKEIVVKASLTEEKLENIVVETRTIIQDLYKNCELDFFKGLKIYNDIINKTIKDTTLIQIKNLEDKRDGILTEDNLDTLKEDSPNPSVPSPSITGPSITGPSITGTTTSLSATGTSITGTTTSLSETGPSLSETGPSLSATGTSLSETATGLSETGPSIRGPSIRGPSIRGPIITRPITRDIKLSSESVSTPFIFSSPEPTLSVSPERSVSPEPTLSVSPEPTLSVSPERSVSPEPILSLSKPYLAEPPKLPDSPPPRIPLIGTPSLISQAPIENRDTSKLPVVPTVVPAVVPAVEPKQKESFLYRGLKNLVLFSGGGNKTKRNKNKNKNKKTKRRL